MLASFESFSMYGTVKGFNEQFDKNTIKSGRTAKKLKYKKVDIIEKIYGSKPG